jgi:hypothetical protein
MGLAHEALTEESNSKIWLFCRHSGSRFRVQSSGFWFRFSGRQKEPEPEH